MQFPATFLDSLKGIKGFDKEAFEKVHAIHEPITSIRINPRKSSNVRRETPGLFYHVSRFISHEIPWTQFGFYLEQRPSFTFDPLFHAGCYYVQEASSMFLEQALKQTVDLSKPVKILDLCAAPGGKSTHIQSLITKDSLLVSNEVIRSRVNILKDNIIKWGSENVIVTNNDPKDFAKLENYFDVIVVDAPCSGSGLFRKEPEAIDEWSLNNVQLCSRRQQRILADVWPALKKSGILIYSTCSYSKEEDEEIADWLMKQFTVSSLQLAVNTDWKLEEVFSFSQTYGYRFWPDKLKGEGFFITCFKKKEGEQDINFKTRKKQMIVTKKEMTIINEWIKQEDHELVKESGIVSTIPEKLLKDLEFLKEQLNVQYAGVIAGELVRDKLIPGHALAMSDLVNENVPAIELDYDEAIQFLKKKELKPVPGIKGWHLVNYQSHRMGWVNVLPNRINNYYPKELRILKDR